MKLNKQSFNKNLMTLDSKIKKLSIKRILNKTKDSKNQFIKDSATHEPRFLSLTDIKANISKSNLALQKQLETLHYISLMEINLFFENDSVKKQETLDIKTSIQKSVIDIVNKINYYKSLLMLKIGNPV
ncbi:hypothetical protein [uncultured Algibacter sp.]|uniref:hypothetical protein n=1 Tax=uncultured Algibacter sp. TaxID=298659 RepID=UPI0032166751